MASQYDLNLQDYLRILRRRWKIVAGCCLALGALTLIMTPRARPVYEASACSSRPSPGARGTISRPRRRSSPASRSH
jgi:subunit length determinant Wzz-like protein